MADMWRARVVMGQPKVDDAFDGERLKVEVVVYDEAADRTEPVGLTAKAMERVSSLFVGLPVLDRRHETEAMPGEVVGKVIASRVEGSQIVQTHEYWDASVIREIREGIRQGYSVSWDATSDTTAVCSKCGEDLVTCEHKLGVDDCRLRYSDAIPLEVTRTYAPKVQNTGVRQVLRSLAQQNEEGALMPLVLNAESGPGSVVLSWEAVEGALSYDLFVGSAAGFDTAEAERVEGVESPHTFEGEAGTYFFVLLAITEGESEASEEVEASIEGEESEEAPAEEGEAMSTPADEAVELRMGSDAVELRNLRAKNIELAQRLEKIETERAASQKRQVLSQYRRSGHLSGGLKELEKSLEDVPVEHVNRVLRHVYPGEPRLPGVVLSDASGADEQPSDEIMNRDDVHRVAMRQAERTGRPYEEIRRELVNSLAPPHARPMRRGGE